MDKWTVESERALCWLAAQPNLSVYAGAVHYLEHGKASLFESLLMEEAGRMNGYTYPDILPHLTEDNQLMVVEYIVSDDSPPAGRARAFSALMYHNGGEWKRELMNVLREIAPEFDDLDWIAVAKGAVIHGYGEDEIFRLYLECPRWQLDNEMVAAAFAAAMVRAGLPRDAMRLINDKRSIAEYTTEVMYETDPKWFRRNAQEWYGRMLRAFWNDPVVLGNILGLTPPEFYNDIPAITEVIAEWAGRGGLPKYPTEFHIRALVALAQNNWEYHQFVLDIIRGIRVPYHELQIELARLYGVDAVDGVTLPYAAMIAINTPERARLFERVLKLAMDHEVLETIGRLHAFVAGHPCVDMLIEEVRDRLYNGEDFFSDGVVAHVAASAAVGGGAALKMARALVPHLGEAAVLLRAAIAAAEAIQDGREA